MWQIATSQQITTRASQQRIRASQQITDAAKPFVCPFHTLDTELIFCLISIPLHNSYYSSCISGGHPACYYLYLVVICRQSPSHSQNGHVKGGDTKNPVSTPAGGVNGDSRQGDRVENSSTSQPTAPKPTPPSQSAQATIGLPLDDKIKV